MGGTPAEVPERYRDGSPREMLPLRSQQFLVSAAVLDSVSARAYETGPRCRR
jgi:hypothetical protein